jgi:hypothetical protein
MRLFCPQCFRFTDHIRHCSYCNEPLTVGDEVYKTEDNRIYCNQCCGRFELELPEPDFDEYEWRNDYCDG